MFVSEVSRTTEQDGVSMVWQETPGKYTGVAAQVAGEESGNWVVVNERGSKFMGTVEVDGSLPTETRQQFIQAMTAQAGSIIAGAISWTEL